MRLRRLVAALILLTVPTAPACSAKRPPWRVTEGSSPVSEPCVEPARYPRDCAWYRGCTVPRGPGCRSAGRTRSKRRGRTKVTSSTKHNGDTHERGIGGREGLYSERAHRTTRALRGAIRVATGVDRGGQLPGHGATCASAATLACDLISDQCDPATQVCVARSVPGAACMNDDQCQAYAHCDAATSTCKSRGAMGAPCGSSSECLGALQCRNGVCAVRPGDPVCP